LITREEAAKKAAGIVKLALVLTAIAAIYLGVYVRYVNPDALSDAYYGFGLILLCVLLGSLLAANMVFFSLKARAKFPNLSRMLPMNFALFTLFVLVALPALHIYSLSPWGAVSFLLSSLLAWLAANTFLHFRAR